MRGLIVGTGPSLRDSLHLIPRFDGLVFTCNNSYKDIRTDVWLACDPTWHKHYGQVAGDFDRWHWDRTICERYGYRHVEGVWMVNGTAYSRDLYVTPPGPCGGLCMEPGRISLNHCSGAQLLNLAANQYGCDEVVLIGHDFSYPKDKPRHYFSGLSDKAGEYPAPLRKFSEFDKQGKGDDLLQVYRRIAEQGAVRIINATPESKLPWFPYERLERFITTRTL